MKFILVFLTLTLCLVTSGVKAIEFDQDIDLAMDNEQDIQLDNQNQDKDQFINYLSDIGAYKHENPKSEDSDEDLTDDLEENDQFDQPDEADEETDNEVSENSEESYWRNSRCKIFGHPCFWNPSAAEKARHHWNSHKQCLVVQKPTHRAFIRQFRRCRGRKGRRKCQKFIRKEVTKCYKKRSLARLHCLHVAKKCHEVNLNLNGKLRDCEGEVQRQKGHAEFFIRETKKFRKKNHNLVKQLAHEKLVNAHHKNKVHHLHKVNNALKAKAAQGGHHHSFLYGDEGYYKKVGDNFCTCDGRSSLWNRYPRKTSFYSCKRYCDNMATCVGFDHGAKNNDCQLYQNRAFSDGHSKHPGTGSCGNRWPTAHGLKVGNSGYGRSYGYRCYAKVIGYKHLGKGFCTCDGGGSMFRRFLPGKTNLFRCTIACNHRADCIGFDHGMKNNDCELYLSNNVNGAAGHGLTQHRGNGSCGNRWPTPSTLRAGSHGYGHRHGYHCYAKGNVQ